MATERAGAPPVSLGAKTLQRTGSYARELVKFCRRKPLGAVGLIVLTSVAITAVVAPFAAPDDGKTMNVLERFERPPWWPGTAEASMDHLLGTDRFGRDILSRIMHGARISLYVGFASVIMGCGVGIILGVTSGYFRGRFDLFVQRVVDALMAFPLLVMALALIAALGPSTNNVIIAITIPMAPRMTRIVRGSALTIRDSDYVTAATAIGASGWRIMLFHMLPNVMAPIIIFSTAQLGTAIIVEASLGFLGLGTQEPTPSWGLMLSGSVSDYAHTAPWIPIIPGVMLSTSVFAFNLLGDALRDVLDPRLRQR